MRLADHFHTGGAAPEEYIELFLCRDVFHCTPSALRREKWVDVMNALTCVQFEARDAKRRRRK